MAQGLRYPWELAGQIGEYNFVLSSARARARLAKLSYEAAHLLIPGQSAVLAVSVYLPRDAHANTRARALSVLRSLTFLPPGQRVAYRMQPVYDTLLGMVAGYVPVPDGYAFQGGVVPQAGLRWPAFALIRSPSVMRFDVIYVNSEGVQTRFAANAQTRLTWNGSPATRAGGLCLTQQSQTPQFLLQLWGMETGASWTLREARPIAERSRVSQFLNQLKRAMGPRLTALPQQPGTQAFDFSARFFVSASSGGLLRKAYVEIRSLGSRTQSFAAAHFSCHAYLQATVMQARANTFDHDMGIFAGVLLGTQGNPEWALREAERSRAMSREQTRMVLEMTRQSQEFNTWMSRSWTNLLSDQTYVRDPATGEVFRTYKQSFDTGTFWRDPVFGGIVGGVERGGRLEEMLQTQGWRRLEESLSGLPGTWR
ncbi:MAG: hypothetical protein N0A24_09880 [Armatimonadetes bacterium]|nr:hypothetical protein [Armatimonadota bacterium]MDW8154487.1 hypothetical protein [Armatimonadota bacterium]